MRPYARSVAIIRHAETKEEFEIEASLLDFQEIGIDERSMGAEIQYQAIIEHEQLGELSWSVWEYPMGVENYKETEVGVHRVVRDFDFGFVHEPEPDDLTPENLPDVMANNEIWVSSLSDREIIGYLKWWFFHFYEDPAQETPYVKEEGGYIYLYGGPFNASEELQDSFSDDVVSYKIIEQTVDEIQQDGIFEWAPSPRHPNIIADLEERKQQEGQEGEQHRYSFEALRTILRDSENVSLDSDSERSLRRNIFEQLDRLLGELPDAQTTNNIGHNFPPEEYRMRDNRIIIVENLTINIRNELEKDAPDIEEIIENAQGLESELGWFASKFNMTVDAFCKSFGKNLGKATAISIPVAIYQSPIWEIMAGLLNLIKDWLVVILLLL